VERPADGGRTGIRTRERVALPTVFKTAAFVRSAILPSGSLPGDRAGRATLKTVVSFGVRQTSLCLADLAWRGERGVRSVHACVQNSGSLAAFGQRSLVFGSFHATAGRRQRSLGRVTIPSVAVRLSHTRRLPSCDMNQIERDPANTGRTPAARLWPGGGSGMSSYRIICDNQAPVGAPKKHAHVVEVGVGTTAANWNRLLTLSQVLGMMARGDTFHTVSKSTGKVARVLSVACGVCGRRVIRSSRSSRDAVTDNNLDGLPDCAK
jgi:hypothetical protein